MSESLKPFDVFADIATTRLSETQAKKIRSNYRSGDFSKVFPAGSSAIPSLMVGRQSQIAQLSALAKEVIDNDNPSIVGVVLHGPRGTGKTALLNALHRGLNSIGYVDVISMTGNDELTSDEKLIERLSKFITPKPELSEKTSRDTSGRLDLGLAAGRTSARVEVEQRVSGGQPEFISIGSCLHSFLDEAPERPAMFLVDEAHGADPAVLGHLLNAIQSFTGADDHSIGIVLAGTPETLDVLRHPECKATWFRDRAQSDRFSPMPNDLSALACQHAVDAILKAADVSIHDYADLEHAVQGCKGSPYFLQLLGKAALESASRNEGVADFQVGGEIDRVFKQGVQARYEETWNDLEDKGLTGCALQLGALWKAAKANGFTIDRQLIRKAIQSGLDHGPRPDNDIIETSTQANTHFKHLGLLWSPSRHTEGPWDLGLPSFFDFVEERFEKITYRQERQQLSLAIRNILQEIDVVQGME